MARRVVDALAAARLADVPIFLTDRRAAAGHRAPRAQVRAPGLATHQVQVARGKEVGAARARFLQEPVGLGLLLSLNRCSREHVHSGRGHALALVLARAPAARHFLVLRARRAGLADRVRRRQGSKRRGAVIPAGHELLELVAGAEVGVLNN